MYIITVAPDHNGVVSEEQMDCAEAAQHVIEQMSLEKECDDYSAVETSREVRRRLGRQMPSSISIARLVEIDGHIPCYPAIVMILGEHRTFDMFGGLHAPDTRIRTRIA